MDKDIKSVHEGKRFPCSQCEYKATQKGNLQKHIKSVHEGQISPCSHCGNRYTDRSSLMRHIKTVHEDLVFPCSQCGKTYTAAAAPSDSREVYEVFYSTTLESFISVRFSRDIILCLYEIYHSLLYIHCVNTSIITWFRF